MLIYFSSFIVFKKLEDAKLKAEKVEEVNKDIKEGIVISQETEANSTANAGDVVKIHVSIGSGIPQVVVPGVVGKNENEAKSALEAKNLKVNIEYEEDSTKNNGEVLRQSIKAGENIDEGTEITITVNKLAEMKDGTVNVNLKSLLKYTPSKDDEGKEIIENGQVKIVVGNDTIYNESKPKTTTNISAKFSAKGNVTIKIYVDDILKGTKEINMNVTTTCTFE